MHVAGLSSAAWYDKRQRKSKAEKLKPGPIPKVSDLELLNHIKSYLKEPTFTGEGYQKIHARLQERGIQVGKNRVYNIMKQEGLLFNSNAPNGSTRVHDGKIITNAPNQMWATDGKEFRTEQDGKCWFMGVIDHFNDEIISFHVTTKFDSIAAMEPLKKAVKKVYGSLDKDVCAGIDLALRADHGSQYDSKVFQKEVAFLGLGYSPAFVRSPECNGVIERFHRTINEQIFKNMTFDTIEQANIEIGKFIEKYNDKWILHRLKLKSPLQYRNEYQSSS